MTKIAGPGFMLTFFATDKFPLDTAFPAGFSLITAAPTHPQGTTRGERVMKLDFNAGSTQVTFAANQGSSITPDTANRAMANCPVVFRVTGFANQTVVTNLFSWNGFDFKMDTARGGGGTMTINVTVTSGGAAVGSITGIAEDTWYILDAYTSATSPGGSIATNQQVYVRRIDSPYGTNTENPMFNVVVLGKTPNAPQSITVGESAATNNAGFIAYIATLGEVVQNGDDVFGVMRTDQMPLTTAGAGFYNDMNDAGSPLYSHVNEMDSSSAPTDGAGFEDTRLIAQAQNGTNLYQSYLTDAGAYIGASDTLVGVTFSARCYISVSAAKGSSSGITALICDAAGFPLQSGVIDSAATYHNGFNGWCRKPDTIATQMVYGDLAGLEVGFKFVSVNPGPGGSATAKGSTVELSPFYVKNGDTLTAVPQPPPFGEVVFVRQAVNRASTY